VWIRFENIQYVSIITILQSCQAVQTHQVTSTPSSGFQYQNLAYGSTAAGHRNTDAFEPSDVAVSPLRMYWILSLWQLHDVYCSK